MRIGADDHVPVRSLVGVPLSGCGQEVDMISPVVDQRWLEAHGEALVIADVRWYLDGRSGFDAYQHGHLPGAIFVDLETMLAAPASKSARQ